MQDFYNVEEIRESKIFKEIDLDENNEHFETVFEFSVQDLHNIYRDFLHLPTEQVEEGEETKIENDDENDEEEGKTDEEKNN